jgi:DNA-binding transcriptional MerR regulator
MSDADGLRIGELAQQAGCSTSAVRYYERVGLLDPPERVSGQRRYEARAVERVKLIRVLRGAGLGIRDLEIALDCSPEGLEDRRAAARRRAAALRSGLRDSARALAILEHAAECSSLLEDDAGCAADIERRLEAFDLAQLEPLPEQEAVLA